MGRWQSRGRGREREGGVRVKERGGREGGRGRERERERERERGGGDASGGNLGQLTSQLSHYSLTGLQLLLLHSKHTFISHDITFQHRLSAMP